MNCDKDEIHEQEMVMPGFRFHPTEEELVEFYLRRKVEGKGFNVEIITFVDLYRYDPWELPALAAIWEKEWFFYVPRDRKYRNGDRPNRVTTSGYWKATGADRMIRNDNLKPIGLKKTLVFYSGKAPKGIRSSWIMNEYRLPHHETQKLHKAEICLCRVYKRTGGEDHAFTPLSSSRISLKKPVSGNNSKQGTSSLHNNNKVSTANHQLTAGGAKGDPNSIVNIRGGNTSIINTDSNSMCTAIDARRNAHPNEIFGGLIPHVDQKVLHHQEFGAASPIVPQERPDIVGDSVSFPLVPPATLGNILTSSSSMMALMDEDVRRLVEIQQQQYQENHISANYPNLSHYS